MRKTVLVIIAVLYLSLFAIVKADAGKVNLFYILPKDTIVLGFLGNPYSLDFYPVKLVSYEDQAILLFHKKSGSGIWAFYVRGIHVLGKDGRKETISSDGFFVVKKHLVQKTK